MSKIIWIVARPHVDADVICDGVFSNLNAAEECAKDPKAEYEGFVWEIDLSLVQDHYVSEYVDEGDDD